MNKAVFYAALIALILPLAACGGGPEHTVASGKWRYKMTVAVDTPEGLKTGSAVREVTMATGWSPLPEMTPSLEVKGEAVVVDLGERGVLFALMHGYNPDGYYRSVDYGSDIIFDVFPGPRGYPVDVINFYSTLDGAKRTLQPKDYPMFVHFRNITNPVSVEAVSVTNIEDQTFRGGTATIRTLENVFGKGVQLKYVTI